MKQHLATVVDEAGLADYKKVRFLLEEWKELAEKEMISILGYDLSTFSQIQERKHALLKELQQYTEVKGNNNLPQELATLLWGIIEREKYNIELINKNLEQLKTNLTQLDKLFSVLKHVKEVYGRKYPDGEGVI